MTTPKKGPIDLRDDSGQDVDTLTEELNETTEGLPRLAEEAPGHPWRPVGPEHYVETVDAWEGMVADPLPVDGHDSESFGLSKYGLEELQHRAHVVLNLMEARGHANSTLGKALANDDTLGRQILALLDGTENRDS